MQNINQDYFSKIVLKYMCNTLKMRGGKSPCPPTKASQEIERLFYLLCSRLG